MPKETYICTEQPLLWHGPLVEISFAWTILAGAELYDFRIQMEVPNFRHAQKHGLLSG